MFVDQRWIDFAPALFDAAIVDDSGMNVAYWNLPLLRLARDGERITVNGQPLRFFHFSGFSPEAADRLSKHAPIHPSDQPLVAEPCARYAAALEEAGFAESSVMPYGFATTAGGLTLDPRMRRTLRRTYMDDEASGHADLANPFSPGGAEYVVQRLMRPSPDGSSVPSYLGEIWSDRADLRVAFPRIGEADAQRFLERVRTQGVREPDIPSEIIRR